MTDREAPQLSDEECNALFCDHFRISANSPGESVQDCIRLGYAEGYRRASVAAPERADKIRWPEVEEAFTANGDEFVPERAEPVPSATLDELITRLESANAEVDCFNVAHALWLAKELRDPAKPVAINALKNIEHATAPGSDGAYHEAAYTLARKALSDLKWGTVDGAFLPAESLASTPTDMRGGPSQEGAVGTDATLFDLIDVKARYPKFADAEPYVNDFVDRVNKRCDRWQAEHARLTAKLAEVERETERWRELFNDEYRIVERIWAIFDSPTYQELNGSDIYSLINSLKAERDAVLAKLAACERERDTAFTGWSTSTDRVINAEAERDAAVAMLRELEAAFLRWRGDSGPVAWSAFDRARRAARAIVGAET